MLVAELTQSGFDILDLLETDTSIIRQSNLVRLSWKDENNNLIQLVKDTVASPDIGTLLVSHGNCLLPTGDRQSSRTVGKLLAPVTASTQQKNVTIGGTNYTAHLLPVQII